MFDPFTKSIHTKQITVENIGTKKAAKFKTNRNPPTLIEVSIQNKRDQV